jgi:hypothetical protein
MSPTIYPEELHPKPKPQPEPPPVQPAAPPVVPPPLEEVETEEDDVDVEIVDEDGKPKPVAYRGASNDPVFGYVIAVALSIGLTPLIPAGQVDLRYTILWMIVAGFGVLAWLLGNMPRIGQETPENLGWGIIFGLILSVPLLAFGGETLRRTDLLLFGQMSLGGLLAYLVFVIPAAETLFFRGVLQENRPFLLVGLLSSVWSALVFFPVFWQDIGTYPAVAVVIGTAFIMMNIMYSYVRQRNGLAAAWLCQIVVNLVLLFIPFIGI